MSTKDKLETAIEKLKPSNSILSINPILHDSTGTNMGLYIPIEMFHYRVGDNEEFIMFELELSDNGQCQSMRAEFVDNNDSIGYDVLHVAPYNISIIDILKSVESRNTDDEPIIIDLNHLRKTEALLTNTVKSILDSFKALNTPWWRPFL